MVRSAAKSVYRELESGEVSQRWVANGAISAVPVRDVVPEGESVCNSLHLDKSSDWDSSCVHVSWGKKEIPANGPRG